MQDFRELKVWERGHQLTLAGYATTANFPREEKYGLTSQIRRCTSSIPANIAEGSGRGSNADFARFLSNAIGSACELEYHLILAHDLGYLDMDPYHDLVTRLTTLRRMLISLRSKARIANDPP